MEAPAAAVGRAAPAFRLRALDGSLTALTDHRGQYVLLNFWASWCGPCRGETPELQEFFERQSPGLVVVGVNQQETVETAREFAEAFGVTYPIPLDTDGQVSSAYRVSTGLPVSFLIDPEGVIQTGASWRSHGRRPGRACGGASLMASSAPVHERPGMPEIRPGCGQPGGCSRT